MTGLDRYPTKRASPVFIVSSGRSGIASVARLLRAFPEIEVHTDYLSSHVQPLASRYYMGLVGQQTVRATISRLHGTALLYSQKPLWCDASNKLPWILDVVAETFEDAKFVHLTRDGRKVVASHFQKLGREIYDDFSVRCLIGHLDAPNLFPPPPPEARFWAPMPLDEPERMEAFRSYSQFQRICFHWAEINRVILGHLYTIPKERQFRVKLENLVSNSDYLADLLRFIGLPERREAFKLLRKPLNVRLPQDAQLNPRQEQEFFELAGDVMKALQYTQARAYQVNYGEV